ncbi:MAG: ADP-ribose pyrophosphatase [Planctomycetota bacterium]|jgi:ADP-ribose pyrophosphatase
MNRHPEIEVTESERVFEGRIYDVVVESLRLPSGLEQKIAVVDHHGAVAVAPLTAEGRLILVRQYRHATGDWLVEVPAGRLEADENTLTAARRELEEETGYRAANWEILKAFFPAPGFCSELITLYLATDLEAVPGGGLECDSDEEFSYLELTPQEVLASDCKDAKTLLAAALLLDRASKS